MPGNSDWFRFALGVLATWRVTHLFIAEDGPAGILSRLREFVARGFLRGLLGCFYCLSLWTAIPFCLLVGRSVTEQVLLWPALSAAAIMVENLSARLGSAPPALYFEEGDKNDELLRKEHDRGESAS
jgi:hypothetical protein